MKFAVVVFPGSNCDHDAYYAAKHVLGQDAEFVWHKETSLTGADVVILPGGFSHGDYLRTGAIARFSPVMTPVARVRRARADRSSASATASRCCSRPGCCPGRCCATRSQVSLRAGLVRVEQTDTPFTRARVTRPGAAAADRARRGQLLRRARGVGELKSSGRVVFRYCDAPGTVTDAANPNGSLNNIAGICNEARNVVGLMPHPERACEAVLGSADGAVIFESASARLAGAGRAAERVHSTGMSRDRLRCSRASRTQAATSTTASSAPGARADPHRARHLLGDVDRALQLQELARPPAEAADDRSARAAGAGRERRRRRHRRRPGRGLQDRIAQPPVVRRAVPGRRDRRRRHPPRHLHHGRAADRAR